jgi:predicted TPR repeat methyltransferase
LAGLSLIDLGCGEGRYTRSFARRGAHMTGVDISPRMLELARQEESRELVITRRSCFSSRPERVESYFAPRRLARRVRSAGSTSEIAQ